MKKKTLAAQLVIVLSVINAWAEPGGTYTLTGKEKGLAEIIKADMAKHPDLYKGESLNGYVIKFKKENRIGKRKLSPGDQLHFPDTIASLRAKKDEPIYAKVDEDAISRADFTSKRIDGSDGETNELIPGRLVLCKTSEGNLCKFLIEQCGYNLVISWTTYRPDGSVRSEGKSLRIRGTWSCDLDGGKESKDGADFFWQQVTECERYLTPVNGAVFAGFGDSEDRGKCSPEISASLKAKKNSEESAEQETGEVAVIYCKQKSDKFRDGAKLFYNSDGIDVEFINVPDRYRDNKITRSIYKSTELIEFQVKQAGLVAIAIYDGISKKYRSDGWREIGKLEVYDNGARKGRRTKLFVLLEKHHDVGTYEIGGETLWGGIHLIH